MLIKQEVIERLNKNLSIKVDLAKAAKKQSIRTVERWLKENEENGPLTTEASLQIIESQLKISRKKILEGQIIPTT